MNDVALAIALVLFAAIAHVESIATAIVRIIHAVRGDDE